MRKRKKNPTSNRAKKKRELIAIGKRFRKFVKGPVVDHGDFLYDEKGLPK